MKAWWFRYHSVKGKGYVTTKSIGLDDVLSHKNLQYLLRLDSTRDEPPTTFFFDDKVIAVSYIGTTIDDYHRPSMYNFSIIMYWWDYFKFQGAEKFEPYFIKETDETPKGLGVLHIK